MRQNSRNLHDCKLMFQKMWELYDVTLQVIVSFKFYVMNCVDFIIDFCSYITSHVSQAFCQLHTQHKLFFAKLCTCNCVCLWSDQPRLKITLSFFLCRNCFCCFKNGGDCLKSKVMFGNNFCFLFSKTCFWEYKEKTIFLYF